MDEVHFCQHGSRCRMWVPPEVDDPICLHAPTRKSISFFGAVRLHDGKLLMSRPEGMFDAGTCWDFLRRLERISRQRGREVVVISDNARYHHAALHATWRQEVVEHFRLHFLPPYSPELNPIERVWKLIRRCCLHNHYFPDLACVVAAIAPRLQAWSRPNATLRRLCCIA
jgi:DDE superfamily endonuclease